MNQEKMNIDSQIEYTGAGSAYRVMQWHKKQERDASGQIPVIIKIDPNEGKKKNKIN